MIKTNYKNKFFNSRARVPLASNNMGEMINHLIKPKINLKLLGLHPIILEYFDKPKYKHKKYNNKVRLHLTLML